MNPFMKFKGLGYGKEQGNMSLIDLQTPGSNLKQKKNLSITKKRYLPVITSAKQVVHSSENISMFLLS